MPEISRFPGIVVGMFFNEHGPPHFHAVYGDRKITVEIESGVVRGTFPPRALRLVLEWAALHKPPIAGELGAGAQSPTARPYRTAGVSTMPYDVVEARHVGGFIIWLRFRDGTTGEIDLNAELHGPMFEPLRDPVLFRAFQIHPEFQTLVWPNGADFAPEFLHDKVRVTA